MRRVYLLAIAVAIVLFLVISALLARVFSANSAEQSAITTLVKAQARGDTTAIIDAISGCRAAPACRRRADEVAALRHPGAVSIIQIQPSTSFSIGPTSGIARVAWNVAGRPHPIVQCVRVRRTGNVISGLRVELVEVSRRIKSDAPCPARF